MGELIFNCSLCGKKSALTTDEAEEYCNKIIFELQKNGSLVEGVDKKKFSTEALFGKGCGQMFGVLICKEPSSGQKVILKAFSGQFNGLWLVPGWVPPLINLENFTKAVSDVDPILKKMTLKLETVESSNERKKIINERKKLSQKHMKEIHSFYEIRNFRGDKASLFELFNKKKGIPAGTGDCCAPKLINQAIIQRLKPLSLAEFFFGRENRSGSKQNGVFYPPCKEKCQPILGFMLCGADK